MYGDYIDALAKSPLLQNLTKDDIQSFLRCLQPGIHQFAKFDYITIAGDPFSGIGLLLQGRATVTKETVAGDRVMMTTLEPGDVFGEMVAFSRQVAWPASVQAQESAAALFVPKDKIVADCGKVCPWHRTIVQNLLGILSERALLLNKKVAYLTIKSIRGKLATYLLEQYHQSGATSFTLPLNRNDLADSLNVSRPSLSRELCRLRDEGTIGFHLANITIYDLASLRTAAGGYGYRCTGWGPNQSQATP